MINKEIVDLVLLITQILILVILIIYVIKTWRISSATQSAVDVFALSLAVMKEARDMEIAPNVTMYFDMPPGEQNLYLIIKNIGKSTARDVRLEFKPKLICSAGDEFSELPAMKNGISSLSPNHELKTFIDSTVAFFFENSDRSLTYETSVSFYGGLKETQRVSEQILDLTTFKRLSKISQRGSHDLAHAIETISKSIDRISKEFSTLNDNLSGGVQIRNAITSASVQTEGESWQHVISSKLLEFKHLWGTLYGGNREKLLQPFLGKFKNRLSHITDQILATTSLSPPDTDEELKNSLLDLVARLADLNSMRIYLDDAKSVSEFNSSGDKILGSIEELVAKNKTSVRHQ